MLRTELGAAMLADGDLRCASNERSFTRRAAQAEGEPAMSMSPFVEYGQSDRNKSILGVAEAPYWPALVVSFGLLAPLAWNLSLVWICGRTIGVW